MVSVRCRNLVVALVVGLAPIPAAALVKQSSSGLCHPPQSPWYERTTRFTPHSTLGACLASGGRLPEGISLAGSGNAGDDYQRSDFGHGWDDRDGDCQDSRAEALIATSTTTVRFADADRCRVVTGRWISPFTGQVLLNASDIDIDHVVPLAWAWEHGASEWPSERREAFANDPVNLWPVEASLNRSKGARGPEAWMPPSGQCQYISRFARIVIKYDLKPTQADAQAFRKSLDTCRR